MRDQILNYTLSRLSATSEFWSVQDEDFTKLGTLKHILLEQLLMKRKFEEANEYLKRLSKHFCCDNDLEKPDELCKRVPGNRSDAALGFKSQFDENIEKFEKFKSELVCLLAMHKKVEGNDSGKGSMSDPNDPDYKATMCSVLRNIKETCEPELIAVKSHKSLKKKERGGSEISISSCDQSNIFSKRLEEGNHDQNQKPSQQMNLDTKREQHRPWKRKNGNDLKLKTKMTISSGSSFELSPSPAISENLELTYLLSVKQEISDTESNMRTLNFNPVYMKPEPDGDPSQQNQISESDLHLRVHCNQSQTLPSGKARQDLSLSGMCAGQPSHENNSKANFRSFTSTYSEMFPAGNTLMLDYNNKLGGEESNVSNLAPFEIDECSQSRQKISHREGPTEGSIVCAGSA